jgi:hypothetical protein
VIAGEIGSGPFRCATVLPVPLCVRGSPLAWGGSDRGVSAAATPPPSGSPRPAVIVTLGGLLGGPVCCAGEFVVDGADMPLVEWRLSVLYSSIQIATPWRALLANWLPRIRRHNRRNLTPREVRGG